MTFCRERDDVLDDVAAGAVPSGELASHLQTCAACGAELERRRALLARIDDVTRAWMNAPAPNIVVRLGRPRPWRIAVVSAALAAALAALFIAGDILQKPASTQTVATWRSPTADLLRPTVSVLDTRAL
ncbi:MAG: hypothetical protein JO349_05180 [Candidatus Eremiobacteraeota bacterium]|nr:hypothetical protein [Candidatus Eremiobacteraeota bacterium]